ncbi:MAG: NUDIX hydrolase [Candidatus Bathyarchaeia archaeon]
MKGERRVSAGGVVYRMENGMPLFLLIGFKRRGVWCLPKGLIEAGESELEAAQREVREETGVSRLTLVDKIGSINYQFWLRSGPVSKTVHFYLFETDQTETQVGEEHDVYSWFPYEKAVASLSYRNEREIVEKAYVIIRRRGDVSSDKRTAQFPA